MLSVLALATCVIVVPTDHPKFSAKVIERHERGHCAGMTSEDIVPPAKYSRIPKGMRVEVNRYPLARAREVCAIYGGHSFGCQWFE